MQCARTALGTPVRFEFQPPRAPDGVQRENSQYGARNTKASLSDSSGSEGAVVVAAEKLAKSDDTTSESMSVAVDLAGVFFAEGWSPSSAVACFTSAVSI